MVEESAYTQAGLQWFEARQGEGLVISLAYRQADDRRENEPQTDTFHGYFLNLVPDIEIIETFEFETEHAEMQDQMNGRTGAPARHGPGWC